jgi:hypothetical protein
VSDKRGGEPDPGRAPQRPVDGRVSRHPSQSEPRPATRSFHKRADEAIGRRLERTGSKSAGVMQRRRGERVDSMLDDLEADRSLSREWGIRAAIFVPLLARGEPIGAIAVNDHAGPTRASRRPTTGSSRSSRSARRSRSTSPVASIVRCRLFRTRRRTSPQISGRGQLGCSSLRCGRLWRLPPCGR